jgi:acyl-CoA thioesterase YciA
VEVYAERNPADLQVVKVTQANVTYVAIDRNGQPRQIAKD